MGQGHVVDQQAWAQMTTPDVYFSKAYHQVSSAAEPDVAAPVLLEWADDDGTARLPLILRRIADEDYFDATSAYGYGGPWIEGNPNLSQFRQFIDQWAQDTHVVSSFIRFHPLLDNARATEDIFPLEHLGQTAAWDLRGEEDLVQRMAKNHRKSWRRAIRGGVAARVTEQPECVDQFRALYEISMDRLSARDFYWFTDDYWSSMRENLRDSSLLVEAVFEDRVIAAAWCLFSDDFIHFHLSGTTDEGRELGGAFVCRVAAAEWARKKGMIQGHFGGGAGGADSSLLDWKRRFDESSPLCDFFIAKVVHSPDQFERLAGATAGQKFFPPWRAPK